MGDERDQAELTRLRNEYREVKEALRSLTKAGIRDEIMRQRCRDAKSSLKAFLEPGESVLGGAARTEKLDDPIKGRRIPIPAAMLAHIPTPLPLPLRQQQIFTYDTQRFPFREIVSDALGVDPMDLPVLHKTAAHSEACSLREGTRWMNRWHALQSTPARQNFSELLHQFVTEFVAPRMNEHFSLSNSMLPNTTSIAYQRDATFRVQVPAQEPMGYLHCDAEYHHPPAEVNWWLPLTKVSSPNTLHVESEPGKGDFVPAELEYGQVLRFYGNLCQHHTVANSSDVCRVSFDFRVLPLRYHDPLWIDQRGRTCTFEVGVYYRTVEGAAIKTAS